MGRCNSGPAMTSSELDVTMCGAPIYLHDAIALEMLTLTIFLVMSLLKSEYIVSASRSAWSNTSGPTGTNRDMKKHFNTLRDARNDCCFGEPCLLFYKAVLTSCCVATSRN